MHALHACAMLVDLEWGRSLLNKTTFTLERSDCKKITTYSSSEGIGNNL
jgi:hypothetical protein